MIRVQVGLVIVQIFGDRTRGRRFEPQWNVRELSSMESTESMEFTENHFLVIFVFKTTKNSFLQILIL